MPIQRDPLLIYNTNLHFLETYVNKNSIYHDKLLSEYKYLTHVVWCLLTGYTGEKRYITNGLILPQIKGQTFVCQRNNAECNLII